MLGIRESLLSRRGRGTASVSDPDVAGKRKLFFSAARLCIGVSIVAPVPKGFRLQVLVGFLSSPVPRSRLAKPPEVLSYGWGNAFVKLLIGKHCLSNGIVSSCLRAGGRWLVGHLHAPGGMSSGGESRTLGCYRHSAPLEPGGGMEEFGCYKHSAPLETGGRMEALDATDI